MKTALRYSLVFLLALLTCITAYADSIMLITWNYASHQYQTYGNNHYTTYDYYLLTEKSDGTRLLFADLGDSNSLMNLLNEYSNSCVGVSIYLEDTGRYSLGIRPCWNGPNYVTDNSGDRLLAQEPAFASIGSNWQEFPYSKALCEAMSVCQ